MMRASQTLLTEEHMKELKLTSAGKPIRQDISTPMQRSTLQKLLLPKTESDDADRYFIPSPICTSTAAFRFPISIDLTLKFIPPTLPPTPTVATRVTAWSPDCR